MTKKLMNNVRSTAVIDNSEHNDAAGAKKILKGTAGQIKQVIADSTVATVLKDNSVLRVANTTGATAFIWVGLQSAVPGSATIANAFALPPNSVECIFVGESSVANESLMMKASVAGVQVILLNE